MRVLVACLLSSVCLFSQSVWFEPNRGQVAGRTEWIGRSKGAYVYITGDEVVYANRKNVHMRLVGASKRPAVEGVEPTGGYSSYFTGRDEKTWFTRIPHYARLRYREVYPGVDMVYYGSGRNVEYDFVVKPDADPEQIELAFSEPVKVDDGDLIVAGLRQHRPKVVQDGREIEAAYRIGDKGHVQLAVAEYDPSRALIVDPVLEFSTYLGGPGDDRLEAVTSDSAGFGFVAGGTQSVAAPGLDPFQQPNLVGLTPILVKFTPDQRVVFYVELGANGWDSAQSLALDSVGNIVLLGSTRSPTFPLKNPVQDDFKGGLDTLFVSKLGFDGKTLLFSTYFGGSSRDYPGPTLMDEADNAYFTGATYSADFPTTVNSYQPHFGGDQDCYLFKLSKTGSLIFSTYFGGPGREQCLGMARDRQGNILIGGGSTGDIPLKNPIQSKPKDGAPTPTLMKFGPEGALLFSSYFGGPTTGSIVSVSSDPSGFVYVGGTSGDQNLLTKAAFQSTYPGSYSGFLAKLTPDLSNLEYSSYFGASSGTSVVQKLLIDSNGFIYLFGRAGGPDFPQKNALQEWKGGGILSDDCFVAKFSPSATSLIYSTPIGGTGNENCEDAWLDHDRLLVVGTTGSSDFPVKNAYQTTSGGGLDAFVAILSDSSSSPPSTLTVTPGRIAFTYVMGDAAVPPQIVTVAGGSFTASPSQPWIAVSGTVSSVSVSINSIGLTPGVYSGAVTLRPVSGPPSIIDVALTVLAPAPVITSVEPSIVAIGSNDTAVTVGGRGFTGQSRVQVDGLPWTITPLRFVSASTLQFDMPRTYFSVQYNHTIAVQNPNSALSNVLSLAVGAPAPSFTAGSVTNAASYATGSVAPGEIITIFGTNLDSKVTFDSIPATLVYSSPTQVSVTVPYSIAAPTTTIRSGSSAPVTLPVGPSAPGIFAAVADPVNAGVLTLYATGCGALTDDSLPRCALPVSVTVNGQPADVLYAGIAPGLVEGANQVNIRLPEGVGPGPLHIVLQAGDAASKEFLFTLP